MSATLQGRVQTRSRAIGGRGAFAFESVNVKQLHTLGRFFQKFQESAEWGPRGHVLVAQTAQELLNDEARRAVKEILKPIGPLGLGDIATWADVIKHSIPNDRDSRDFINAFPDRGERWHFVDLPLQAEAYDRSLYSRFTREDDVVQMINLSVRVLQGKDKTFSQLNALRWLTHLVGDIHQPLHVACGYVDETGDQPKLTGDPDYIANHKLVSDRGGNNLVLSPAGTKELNLHSYWDGMLGFRESQASLDASATESETQLVAALLAEWPPAESTPSLASPNEETALADGVAAWATESLKKARTAYQSIVIAEKLRPNKYRVEWEGKEAYEKRCLPVVEAQLKLASQRLADLLNRVLG